MITFPNAKINLGLNITEKRSDGYHNLETVFYPVPLEDVLEVHEWKTASNKKFVLHQSGLNIEGDQEHNLVVKAYRLLDDIYSLPPVEIFLYKHIPSGAGLGGGSSDAAFMLKLLNHKFELNISDSKLEEYAVSLGADCAFFIKNSPTFAEGIGNIFSPVSLSLKGYGLLLIKPDLFVSTRDAFSLVKPCKPQQSLKEIIAKSVADWKELMVNDFEESVFSKYPAVRQIKEELYAQGAIYASMSGSGSSVFGLFAPQAEIPNVNSQGQFAFSCVL